MTDRKISLCLAYPHYSNPDSHILFRIADYSLDEDRLYSVAFNDEDFTETPRRIGANPKDIHPGMTALREWEFDADNSGKTRSYNYEGNIYELCFAPENTGLDRNDMTALAIHTLNSALKNTTYTGRLKAHELASAYEEAVNSVMLMPDLGYYNPNPRSYSVLRRDR